MSSYVKQLEHPNTALLSQCNGQSTNPHLTYPARNKALLNPYFWGRVRLTGHLRSQEPRNIILVSTWQPSRRANKWWLPEPRPPSGGRKLIDSKLTKGPPAVEGATWLMVRSEIPGKNPLRLAVYPIILKGFVLFFKLVQDFFHRKYGLGMKH